MQVTAQGGASPATGHSARGHGSSGGEQHATGLLCCQCRPASKSAVPCMRRQPGTVPLQAFSRAAPVLSCAVYWCSPLSVEPCCSGVGAGTWDRGASACAVCLVHCCFPSVFSCVEEAAELLYCISLGHVFQVRQQALWSWSFDALPSVPALQSACLGHPQSAG